MIVTPYATMALTRLAALHDSKLKSKYNVEDKQDYAEAKNQKIKQERSHDMDTSMLL